MAELFLYISGETWIEVKSTYEQKVLRGQFQFASSLWDRVLVERELARHRLFAVYVCVPKSRKESLKQPRTTEAAQQKEAPEKRPEQERSFFIHYGNFLISLQTSLIFFLFQAFLSIFWPIFTTMSTVLGLPYQSGRFQQLTVKNCKKFPVF